MDQLLNDTRDKMLKAMEHLAKEFVRVRTGRANPAMLENVMVDYYGNPTPLNQVGNVSVPEPQLIIIAPWEKSLLGEIEKSLMRADSGMTPQNDGNVIRLPIPPLTEERRKQLVKKVGALGEDAKTAVRQIRRDANDEFKKLQKDGDLSEDDAHRSMDEVQKLTDRHTGSVDELCKNKEKELMEI